MNDFKFFNKLNKILFVIAEVKRGGYCRLNGPWTNSEVENLNRILYAIGMFIPKSSPMHPGNYTTTNYMKMKKFKSFCQLSQI